jgi:AcrR family transcriptional regulator
MSFCPDCKRARSKVATRAHILATARSIFAAHGYEAVTLRTIAGACGCSTGAIFAHWKSKDALFAEATGRPHLTDARGAELLAALKAVAPAQADALLGRWGA